jgi:hypothetical protein
MIILPLLDIVLLLFNTFFAIYNRGTIWGWLSTAFVVYQVWVLIRFVRAHP